MSPGGFDSVAAGLGGVTDGFSVVGGAVVVLGVVVGITAGLEGGELADPPPLLHPVAIRATTLRVTPNGRRFFMDTLLITDIGCCRR
jgi:hypothetical protein